MKKIIYVETSPSFNRWDIIGRVKRRFYQSSLFDELLFIVKRKDRNTYIWVRREGEILLETRNYILEYFLKRCTPLCILDENAELDLEKIIKCKCYVAGLHSDVEGSFLESIEESMVCYRVSLSKIPYLASMLIPVIEVIHDSTIHYIYL